MDLESLSPYERWRVRTFAPHIINAKGKLPPGIYVPARRWGGAKRGIASGAIVVLAAVAGLVGYRVWVADAKAVSNYAVGAQSVPYTSVAGRYSASFPTAPDTELKAHVVNGVTVPLTMRSSGGRSAVVQVGFVDLPSNTTRHTSSQIDRVLRAFPAASAQSVEGRLIWQRPATMLRHRAIDYRIDTSGGTFYGRAFIVGRRLYVLQAVSPENGPQALDRLIRSFRLR